MPANSTRCSSLGPGRVGSPGLMPGTPMSRSGSAPPSPHHRHTSSHAGSSHENIDVNDNIKVVVRVRPPTEREVSNRDECAVSVNDAMHMQVTFPTQQGPSTRGFAFHGCLAPDSSQSDVLHACGITQLLDAALSGFHATIFAYGQTGSGKTFTMSGREERIGLENYAGDTDDGIVTRAALYLFEQIQRRRDGYTYSLRASYCEIYNEGLYDLLKFTQQQLPVRWDSGKGFYVPDLYVRSCSTLNDMMQVISRGMAHRRMGSHELNLESSRSHSIMTIHCDATPVNSQNPEQGVRYGKVSFVDLAGSERLKDTKSTGDSALKETSSINRSLFTLGKVISALADNQPGLHVPYRDSKLTKLLMDSLGGSALALMIACCSPSAAHVEETLSTLSYATRAKNIRNTPFVQMDPKDAMIAALQREVHLLRSENSFLRDQAVASALPSGMATPMEASRAPSLGSYVQLDDIQGPIGQSPPPGISSPAEQPERLFGSEALQMGAQMGMPSFSNQPPSHLGPSRAPPDMEPLPRLPGSPSPPFFGNVSNANAGSTIMPVNSSSDQMGVSPEKLAKKLAEAQRLVVQFSRENERLSSTNEQLRHRRLVVDNDYKGALDEVDVLRGRLESLESAFLQSADSSSILTQVLREHEPELLAAHLSKGHPYHIGAAAPGPGSHHWQHQQDSGDLNDQQSQDDIPRGGFASQELYRKPWRAGSKLNEQPSGNALEQGVVHADPSKLKLLLG
ncbi:hypothetical protein WJX74_009789 [Apatococcus lobatus]|uniref:Kinesin-like protein n=1 Tax=Apatococcus lobatus TaxID=904363 RepID=A0AAW1QGY2_9CHLO